MISMMGVRMHNGMVKVVLERAVKHNDSFIKDLARRQGTNHSHLIQGKQC